jgi:DNA-binding CsgD family transcriptional regulator
MSRSDRMTLRDIRRIHTMIEQAGELGTDPAAWRQYLMDQVRHLVRARVAISMDASNVSVHTIPQLIEPLDLGWDECDRRGLHEYFKSGQVITDPAAVALFRGHERIRFITATRRECAGDREWYACPSVSQGRRSANIDDFVSSSFAIAPHVLQGFIFYRDLGETPFSVRERRTLRYAHLCLLRRLHDSSVTYGRLVSQFDLSPRLMETLQLLLGGDGIKAIADKLQVSLHTLNGYVKTIYRRLHVRSRIELITMARKWQPRPFLLPHGMIAAISAARQPEIVPVRSELDASGDGDDEAWGG